MAELQTRREEIAEAGGHVLVVSFGSREGAQQWLDVTGCQFGMVTDEERNVYKAFGLQVSIYKVWNISTMLYYAEQKARGHTLPKKFANVEDDPNQMGGDFILSSSGKIAFLYCSKTAQDRPSVDQLIQSLKDLYTEESITEKSRGSRDAMDD